MTNPKKLKTLPVFETRGKKANHGALSQAYKMTTELRYIKACMNAILENGAFHDHNFKRWLESHQKSPNSKLTDEELNLMKKAFNRRNKIAKKMMNSLKRYFEVCETIDG